MITHHPKHELLNAFVEGELPASLSAAIAVHAEICDVCAKNIEYLTKEASENSFAPSANIYSPYTDKKVSASITAAHQKSTIDSFQSMIDSITESDEVAKPTTKEPLVIEVKGSTYELPTALHSMSMMGWQKMGKLSRSRLNLNEGSIHSSLLHIDKDGGVPSHTHKGFELTLILDGSFEDETGTYEKGDFIWLTNNETHTPFTKESCLCLTVADDALQFTQGLSKLLNPIGTFIY